jgi:hypothetical protein
MEQIGEWLTSYAVKNLVSDTVYAFQAGFAGIDGDWSGSQQAYDAETLLGHFYNMVPSGFYMQVCSVQVKDAAQAKARNTIPLSQPAPTCAYVTRMKDNVFTRYTYQ